MSARKRPPPHRHPSEKEERLVKKVKTDELSKDQVPRMYFGILNMMSVQLQKNITQLNLSKNYGK